MKKSRVSVSPGNRGSLSPRREREMKVHREWLCVQVKAILFPFLKITFYFYFFAKLIIDKKKREIIIFGLIRERERVVNSSHHIIPSDNERVCPSGLKRQVTQRKDVNFLCMCCGGDIVAHQTAARYKSPLSLWNAQPKGGSSNIFVFVFCIFNKTTNKI